MDDWNAQKMLDLYIYDYMIRNNMRETAEIFAEESGVHPKSVAINPPEGFLKEWWSIFWDSFSAPNQKNPNKSKHTSSKVTQIAVNVPQNVTNPNIPTPYVNYLCRNVSSAMHRPILPNLLQTASSTMIPMANYGHLCLWPKPELNPNRFGTEPGLDINVTQGQSITGFLTARMSEQDHLRLPDIDFNSNSQPVDADRLGCMLPYTRSPSHPQKKVCQNGQISLTRDDVGGRPSLRRAMQPTPRVTNVVQIREPAGTGSSSNPNSSTSYNPESVELSDTGSDMSG